MKTKTLILSIIALFIVACSGSKQREETPTTDSVTEVKLSPESSILGQWYIENIFFNDSVYTRPSEEVPGSRQYILFEPDCSYSIKTNSNHADGEYTVNNSTISFKEAAWTELACDNMKTEEAMRKILPLLSTIEIDNDSVMRINSDSGPYLILLKATEKK